jgi:hypothetical protein
VLYKIAIENRALQPTAQDARCTVPMGRSIAYRPYGRPLEQETRYIALWRQGFYTLPICRPIGNGIVAVTVKCTHTGMRLINDSFVT